MNLRTWAAVVSVVTMAGALAAAEANKVEGSYMVDGKTVALKYAYSVKYSYDKEARKAVLLSATALAPQDVATEDSFSHFSEMARDGKLSAMQVNFKADRTISGIFLYDKAFDGALQTVGFEKLETTRFDATGVTGKITMAEPHSFFKQKFQYNATFSVDWTK